MAVTVNRQLLAGLRALQAAGYQVQVNSGVRSRDEQARLYQRYVNSGYDRRYIAARPGTSDHETGNALDLLINGKPAATYGPKFLAHFGLDAPVPGDLVHVTALGGPGQQPRGGATAAPQGGSTEQARNAQLIYSLGYQALVKAHVPNPKQRALELVAAANAESSLRADAHNPSGASGLFQLLSPGYVNKATQMGGVFDPRANANAILPDYVNYWRQNPGAAAGAAGAAVERSGEGAGFYSRSLPLAMTLVNSPAGGVGSTGEPPGNPMTQAAPLNGNSRDGGVRNALLSFVQSGNVNGLVTALARRKRLQA